jgi:hypothetical protein
MPKKRSVPKLPERDRRERLASFLTVLGRDPSLEHFRTIVRTAPERQLALFAALEREVIVGPPAAAPPRHDDEADQLLCDILDVIDSHPDTRDHRLAYFGPDRHLANLQALGLWRGDSPIEQPSARELFTTTFSSLTVDSQSTSPASGIPFRPTKHLSRRKLLTEFSLCRLRLTKSPFPNRPIVRK